MSDGGGRPASTEAAAGDRANPLLEAALSYAARGWPVFPCNPENKQPLLAADKDPVTKAAIKGTGGVSKATTAPEQIKRWWKRWPLAMIGLAMGHNRCFALDFDPRVDGKTGEVWTLERLKEETEAQIGCALPATLAVRTPSDGVHLYFLQPEGDPIRNRGNLPEHVDVRGLGGYVIAPPSVMSDGRRYRWLHGNAEAEIAEAPAELVGVLRAKRGAKAKPTPQSPPASGRGGSADQADDAVRRYALTALDAECREVRRAPSGRRQDQLNRSAFNIATLVAAGALEETLARSLIEAAARDNPGRDDDAQLHATIDSGWTAGAGNPRDLSEVAAASRQRRQRSQGGSFRGSGSSRPPPSGDGPATPRPPDGNRFAGPYHLGREDGSSEPTEADRARLTAIAEAWLARKLEHVAAEKKALTALAWGCGRRIAAGLIDEGAAKERIWPKCEDVADVQHADIDQAIADGIARGFDMAPLLLDLRCSGYPMTDFGIGERFRDRSGEDFRFTTAKGWLGWDGRRWEVLDQEKDVPPAQVMAAVMETVRGIQREGRRVAETGLKLELIREGKQERLAIEDPNEHALDHWVAVNRSWKRYSTLLASFGRQSETAGKPTAIANLARRWLTVPIEEFDCEQYAINLLNGTLRFAAEQIAENANCPPDGTKKASVRLDPHSRDDLITRLAPIAFDRKAASPLYDDMLAWAQPDARMRKYLHQVAGYAATGDTSEHKLWFNYGRGRNGKSTTIDSWCSTLGDYSGTIGIETFLDQGLKKRGDQATPDLAKLGGIRMLRASEPDRDAKLNSALIKAATGGEPMAVRALHRGFFDLTPRFKLLMSGNSKPNIPDTDDGIWSRMKLVPWLKNIDLEFDESGKPKKDPKLLDKIKARELPGVFNRLVEGLVDYLEHGFVEPQTVLDATQAYRDASDPLARFLRLCTVTDADSRVQSSKLHEVFVAWCKAAGEREWSNKGFSNAMSEKGFTKKQSDGMQWLGLRLVRQASDFVDENGKVRETLPDPDEELLRDPAAPEPPRPPPKDDYIPGFDD